MMREKTEANLNPYIFSGGGANVTARSVHTSGCMEL